MIKRIEDFHREQRARGGRDLGPLATEADFLEAHAVRPLHRELAFLLSIGLDFWRGLFRMRRLGPTVTVFGSARFPADHPYYALARAVGRELAHEGFAVMTGGGPSVMEAANRGAKEAGGYSVGCNITLPHEQRHNAHLDLVATFRYFFSRKVMLVKYSCAYVILPGGFGTLDELTEALTLIQTGKLYDFPVVLVGRAYWQGFVDWLRASPVAAGAISASDLDLMSLTDDPAEVVAVIHRKLRGR